MAASAAVPLASLVVSAAKAVQGAQRQLDEQLIYGPAMARSIPRVAVGGQYGIRTVAGKTLLIFGNKGEEDESYRVTFTLHLAQDPMPPLAVQTMPPTSLWVPPFIEGAPVVAQLVRDLSAALNSMDRKLFKDEIKKLAEAAANQDDDPGLVAFRLDGPGEAYLIARIGGSRDGIFLFDRAASPPVTVISHADSDRDTVPWAPFHRLFETIRGWQRSSNSARQLDGGAPDQIGGIDVMDFLGAMWNAYRDARAVLASPPVGATPVLPAFYLLDNLSGNLSYSVPRVVSKEPDDQPPLVRSDVAVSVRQDNTGPVVELRLRAPEYVLVDGQKDGALQLLRENLDADLDHDSFFSIIEPEFQSDYETALRDPARAADAVVLLSYQDQPPKNQFLFVWTGKSGSEERDFAFRFQFDKDKLVSPELVRRLEDGDSVEVDYHKHAAGLHDFFHAAWIWTIMGRWFPA